MNVDELQRHKDIRNDAKNRLPDMIRERLGDYQLESVYAHDVMKNNSQVLLGVTVVPKEQDMAPCIYVEPYLPPDPARFSDERIWDGIAERMARDFRYALEVIEPDQVELFDENGLEEKLILELISRDRNRELLENGVYKEYLDLAAVLRWEMICGGRIGSVSVSKPVFRKWGRSLDELYQIALRNTMRKYPLRIEPLRDVIEDLSQGLLPSTDSPFFYVGTERGIQGSIAILYPGALREIYRRIGEEYYIIPSSINELLALPAQDVAGLEYLKDLISEINSNMLERTEVLTDALYVYRPDLDELEIV